jgi:hypothetical protein
MEKIASQGDIDTMMDKEKLDHIFDHDFVLPV